MDRAAYRDAAQRSHQPHGSVPAADRHTDDLGPLSGLSRLQVLNLHRNGIADLSPLSGMSEMTSLNLGTNRISDLAPLSSMTKLTWLDIQANQISDLSPLSGLGSLSWLNASANRIDDLSPLASLLALSHLDVGFNRIDDLSPLVELSVLVSLVVAGNRVTDLSPLAGLTSLRDLDLQYNAITDLSPLLENSGLSEGSVVDVSHNLLNDQSRNSLVPSLEERGVQIAYTIADEDAFPLAPLTRTYDDRVLAASWPWYFLTQEEKREVFANGAGRAEFDRRRRELFRGFYSYFEDDFDFLVAVFDAEAAT